MYNMFTSLHISDLHNNYPLNLDNADLLCIHGDLTINGSFKEFETFKIWLDKIHHKYQKIVIIYGNHDKMAYTNPIEIKNILIKNLEDKVFILINEYIELYDIKIFGSPYSIKWGNYVFQQEDYFLYNNFWLNIPEDTVMLLTHGPGFGYLDKSFGEHIGSKTLKMRILDLKKLQVHGFGHCHHEYGYIEFDHKFYVNGAMESGSYLKRYGIKITWIDGKAEYAEVLTS